MSNQKVNNSFKVSFALELINEFDGVKYSSKIVFCNKKYIVNNNLIYYPIIKYYIFYLILFHSKFNLKSHTHYNLFDWLRFLLPNPITLPPHNKTLFIY